MPIGIISHSTKRRRIPNYCNSRIQTEILKKHSESMHLCSHHRLGQNSPLRGVKTTPISILMRTKKQRLEVVRGVQRCTAFVCEFSVLRHCSVFTARYCTAQRTSDYEILFFVHNFSTAHRWKPCELGIRTPYRNFFRRCSSAFLSAGQNRAVPSFGAEHRSLRL